MSTGVVVLMTDHGSAEGSRIPLEKAVELLTGAPPLSVDARHFMADGGGRVNLDRAGFEMEVTSEGFVVSPEVLIVYEIPPADRGRLAAFQRQLSPEGPLSFGADPDAWRNATDKRRTVDCFRRDGIPHMETIALCRPDLDTALDAFERLGGDVWARPTVGAGGTDVFHLTNHQHLRAAFGHYAASDQACCFPATPATSPKTGAVTSFGSSSCTSGYCECASTCSPIPTCRATSHGAQCPRSSPPSTSRRSTTGSQ